MVFVTKMASQWQTKTNVSIQNICSCTCVVVCMYIFEVQRNCVFAWYTISVPRLLLTYPDCMACLLSRLPSKFKHFLSTFDSLRWSYVVFMVTGTGVVSSLTITIQQLLKRLIITSASWQISYINLVYCGDPPSTEGNVVWVMRKPAICPWYNEFTDQLAQSLFSALKHICMS